jgi:RecB family exonuclease
MHSALERLYGEPPGGEPLPRPATLEDWVGRGLELVAEEAERRHLSERQPADVAMRRRVERLLAAFLRREAGRPGTLSPRLLEAGFGMGEEDERGPLDLGGWLLHGRIDRVDTGAGGGLLYDYKLARAVTPQARFEREGKLQLPLYLLALRELWGIEAAAALYLPLRATKDPRPRGLARREEKEGALAGIDLVANDLLPDEEFEALLGRIRDLAGGHVAGIRAGAIDRNPLEGRCPTYCTFSQICRRERGIAAVEDPELADEETEP